MKKKIVINALHTKTGGGLVFLNHILPLIAKSKHFEWTVIAHEKYAERLTFIPQNVTLHSVSFRDGFLWTLLWEQVKLPILVRQLGGQVTFNIANYSALFAPKNILFVTNNPEVRHFVPLKQKMYWYFLMWMTRLSLIGCAKALCNGDYMKKVYASGLFSPLQHKMVKATTACDVLVKGKVNKKPCRLVAVGDFYPHKGYDVLLKALAIVKERAPDVELVIIGRAVNAAVKAEMFDLIEELGLKSHVKFKGVLPLTEVQKYLANSTLYVSPSCAEAFSLTLLEAMTLGTASIVKDLPFQREIVSEKEAFLVPTQKGAEVEEALFADAILTLLNDERARKQLEKNAKKVAATVSWKKTAETIVQVLKEV